MGLKGLWKWFSWNKLEFSYFTNIGIKMFVVMTIDFIINKIPILFGIGYVFKFAWFKKLKEHFLDYYFSFSCCFRVKLNMGILLLEKGLSKYKCILVYKLRSFQNY